MKPLIVLLVVFICSVFAIKIVINGYDLFLAGRIAMSAMLLFTAIGHFVYTKGMTMMMPEFIPFKRGIVYFTGIIEIAASIGLLIPDLSILTAWLLILFFVLIMPANIKAAIQRVDFQKETFEGKGVSYLWFRIPLQILFIIWTYLAAIGV